MSEGFNKWWFLPFGIFAASALVALGIVVFEPSFVERSAVAVAWQASGEAPAECTGDSETENACHQERYQGLVRGPGVDVAFTELEEEYENNDYVRANCHQITHVIGRAAAAVYGDIPSTFDQGDNFCWSGYYHGAMETIVARIGPDQVVDEANTLSDNLDEGQRYSFYHYNLVHGLGHGFMGVRQNELFDSLEMCDGLEDQWEKNSCYGGVFMENVMAQSNPNNPSKYLKADQPLYPCTDVEDRYKEECYKMQTSYAIQTQGGFAEVFELCGETGEEFRSTCYQSLGRDASGQSVSEVEQTRETCMRGEDYEARSNCIIGAVKDFVSYYSDDTQARELCNSLEDADLREVCLREGEEYYETLDA